MNHKYNHQGFTLIELLIVITIISILSATAIPQYSDYRKRAFDARARADLTNIAVAEESYFLDAEKYLSCTNTACSNLPGISKISKGVSIAVNAQQNYFTANASHSKGTGKTFRWNSEAGGLTN